MSLTIWKHLLKMIKCMMGLEKSGFIYMSFDLFGVTHRVGNSQ